MLYNIPIIDLTNLLSKKSKMAIIKRQQEINQEKRKKSKKQASRNGGGVNEKIHEKMVNADIKVMWK